MGPAGEPAWTCWSPSPRPPRRRQIMVRVLINVRKDIRANEPFDVKVLVSHPMESGQRRDQLGQAIPRDIIHHFVCTLDGETVVDMDLVPAIAAKQFFLS